MWEGAPQGMNAQTSRSSTACCIMTAASACKFQAMCHTKWHLAAATCTSLALSCLHAGGQDSR